ncbi:MAG: ThuA domain-containing protein [Deltaproteobacteria bacterium]|nr:ThuA domain-containing protein [Deltaproteobacteria bacterium]
MPARFAWASGCLLCIVGCSDDNDRKPARGEGHPAAVLTADVPDIDAACTGTDGPSVIVFTAENLWQHTGNPAARDAILGMCATHGFSVIATHDRDIFESERLATTDVVVFAATSGNVLDELSRAHLEAWMRAGGGLVGLHTADFTENAWDYYSNAIGATLEAHAPGVWSVDITIETSHPIVAHLPARWAQTDEIHVFAERPELTPVTILLAADESTLAADYPEELRVGYHPIAWAHELYGGRVFFSCLGHAADSYEDPLHVEMIARAITWTAGP